MPIIRYRSGRFSDPGGANAGRVPMSGVSSIGPEPEPDPLTDESATEAPGGAPTRKPVGTRARRAAATKQARAQAKRMNAAKVLRRQGATAQQMKVWKGLSKQRRMKIKTSVKQGKGTIKSRVQNIQQKRQAAKKKKRR